MIKYYKMNYKLLRWIASFLPMTKMSFHSFQRQGCRCYDLAMTKLVTPSLRGTKQSRSSRLYLDCFVPRNDGDLYRHHSFLQGILPMPGSRNDETRNPVIARHEAIQKCV